MEEYPTQDRRKRLSHNDHLPVIRSAPSSVAGDCQDIAVFDEDEVPQLQQQLPWHHQQLYQLYGKDADDFLHPKTEGKLQQQQAPRQGQLLLNETHSAGDLWQSLREKSLEKLAAAERAQPSYLKTAYSAFVRDSLQKRTSRSKDNVYLNANVDGVRRLLDDGKIRAAQDYRHKVNIAYRTSHTNQDKFQVLTYHNPLPRLGYMENEDSITSYLPSWNQLSNARSARERKLQELPGARWKKTSGLDQDEPSSDKPRYIFLTEQDAWEPGQFSLTQEEKGGSNSAMALYEKLAKQPRTSRDEHQEQPAIPASSASTWESGERQKGMYEQWQPLSMTALVEYKKHIAAPGCGGFSHGKPSLWALVP